MADENDKVISRVVELITLLAAAPGPPNAEAPRLATLGRWLEDAGVDFSSDAAGNIHVHLGPADAWSETLVLDAHVDVVDPGLCENVEQCDGRLNGLGVGDDLAAVALLAIFAADAVAEGRRFDRPVRIVFTVGEEGLGNLRGVRQIVQDHQGDHGAPAMYVAIDGYFGALRLSGIGSARYRLSISGPGGHSWGRYGIPSATHVLVDLLGRIASAHGRLAEKAAGLLSYNIGILTGGEGINSISRNAVASFEFRSADSETLTEMHTRLADLLDDCGLPGQLEMEMELIGLRPAARPVDNAAYAKMLHELWSARGLKLVETPASTNINLPLAAGWPSVCIGLCQGGNAHRPDEYIELASLPVGMALLHEIIDRHVPAP